MPAALECVPRTTSGKQDRLPIGVSIVVKELFRARSGWVDVVRETLSRNTHQVITAIGA